MLFYLNYDSLNEAEDFVEKVILQLLSRHRVTINSPFMPLLS
jgi:hypothetical protein